MLDLIKYLPIAAIVMLLALIVAMKRRNPQPAGCRKQEDMV